MHQAPDRRPAARVRRRPEAKATIQVDLTPTALRQVRDLRGRRRKAAAAALAELRASGCSAAGYRLAGAVLDHVCCRHLYRSDRVVTAWRADDHAVVIALGRPDRSADDICDTLLDALGLEVSEAERQKPPCCDDEGLPPTDPVIATDIADAIQRRQRARRRGR